MIRRTERSILAVAAIVTLIAVVGCTGLGIDPADTLDPIIVSGMPGGRLNLSVQGTIPAGGTASALGLGSGGLMTASAAGDATIPVSDKDGLEIGIVTLSDARLVLKEFKFKLAEEEVDSLEEEEENDEIKLLGPYVVDLLSDTMTPEPEFVDVIAGTYKEIEMKLDKIEGDEEDDSGSALLPVDDPLFDRSIYLEGTYTGQTGAGAVVAIPFEMSFDIDEEFQLTGTGGESEGFIIDQDVVNPIIVAFRLNKWLDFSNVETNSDSLDFMALTDGTSIVLDESADGVLDTLRDVVKENIKESADYGEDEDNDGELESDEDDD